MKYIIGTCALFFGTMLSLHTAAAQPTSYGPEAMFTATPTATPTPTPSPTPCPGGTELIGGACRPPCAPKEVRSPIDYSCRCIPNTDRSDPRSLYQGYHYCMEDCGTSNRWRVSCDVTTGCECIDKCDTNPNPLYALTLQNYRTGSANTSIFIGSASFLNTCRTKWGNQIAINGMSDDDVLCYFLTGVYQHNAWATWCAFNANYAHYFVPGPGPLKAPVTVAVDKNCNKFTGTVPYYCGSGSAQFYVSPISLIWKPEGEKVWNPTFVSFKVSPDSPDSTVFTWYASESRPLIVRDPKRERKVTSASQLFGNHTLGKEWKNGYEALAVFDQNHDGEISGNELDSLALWFDRNRDGISDKGEVVGAAEAGLKTLFYSPSNTNEATKDIWARKGFEARIDGKDVSGASVDWMSSPYQSAEVGLAAEMAKRAKDSTPEIQPSSVSEAEAAATGLSRAAVEPAKDSPKGKVAGMWRWHLEAKSFAGTVGGSKKNVESSGGLLGFGVSADGRFRGHSYTFIPSDADPEQVFAKVFPMNTVEAVDAEGAVNLTFSLGSESDGAITENTAVVSGDGRTMTGESSVRFAGDTTAVIYRWTAERLD